MNLVDPFGLFTSKCWRPIRVPGIGEHGPKLHEFLCVTHWDGSVTCGSMAQTTANVFGGPSAPTSETANDTCESVAPPPGQSNCMDDCVEGELNSPLRPPYDLRHKVGTDCQAYSENVLNTCYAECAKQ